MSADAAELSALAVEPVLPAVRAVVDRVPAGLRDDRLRFCLLDARSRALEATAGQWRDDAHDAVDGILAYPLERGHWNVQRAESGDTVLVTTRYAHPKQIEIVEGYEWRRVS